MRVSTLKSRTAHPPMSLLPMTLIFGSPQPRKTIRPERNTLRKKVKVLSQLICTLSLASESSLQHKPLAIWVVRLFCWLRHRWLGCRNRNAEKTSPTQLPRNSLAERAGGWGLLQNGPGEYLAMFLSVLDRLDLARPDCAASSPSDCGCFCGSTGPSASLRAGSSGR